MPEGPEIRRVADRLAEVLVDRKVERVRFGLPRLKPEEPLLSGQRVLEVEPRGKALLQPPRRGVQLVFEARPHPSERLPHQLHICLQRRTLGLHSNAPSRIRALQRIDALAKGGGLLLLLTKLAVG